MKALKEPIGESARVAGTGTGSATLVGVWNTLIGETGTWYELWHYENINHAYETPATLYHYPPDQSKLLLPTQFSPLQ
jgi:hypothetical protein